MLLHHHDDTYLIPANAVLHFRCTTGFFPIQPRESSHLVLFFSIHALICLHE
jgi:hypothetical protein